MMTLDIHLVDQLLRNYRTPEDLLGEQGLLKQLTVALLERAISVEMDDPPVYGVRQSFSRNGTNTDYAISVDERVLDAVSPSNKARAPAARLSDPSPSARVIHLQPSARPPQVVQSGIAAARSNHLHDKIASLYARGLSAAEIRDHVQDIYGSEVSISQVVEVTDALSDEAQKWQARPLEALYPIMYFEPVFLKRSEHGQSAMRQVYLAIGVNPEGVRAVLGQWINDPDNAAFWSDMIGALRRRGVEDILIACVDGTPGLTEAIQSIFPIAEIHLNIAQLIRRSLNYVPARSRKAVADDLKQVYRASDQREAARQLTLFAKKWDSAYSVISQLWRRNWSTLAPYFSYPTEIRKVLVATNVIEQVGTTVRKVTHQRDSFPSDTAIMKSVHLALSHIANKRSMPIRDWKAALNRLVVLFEDRMPEG